MKTLLLFFALFLGTQLNAQVLNFEWVEAFGNTEYDSGNIILSDSSGNVLVAGTYWSTVDFDPGPGVVNLPTYGYGDVFVAKYSPTGALIWAKGIGSNCSNDPVEGMTIDGDGNILLSGVCTGFYDFDPGPGVYTLNPADTTNLCGFVLKLNSAGNFVWAKAFISSGPGASNHKVKTDQNNNVIVSGCFFSITDFDPGPATYTLQSNGGQDIFILKLDAAGNFNWVKKIGGGATDIPEDMLVDISGNSYLVGNYNGPLDADPGPGVTSITSQGNFDFFVLRLDPSGNFAWVKTFGGTNLDLGYRIGMDDLSNLYVTGSFTGVCDFDPGPSTYSLTSTAWVNVFVLKLNALGNFLWAKQLKATDDNGAAGLFVDKSGNSYLLGYFAGDVDFDPGAGTTLLSASDGGSFIWKLDTQGDIVFAKQFGSISNVYGNDIVVTPDNIINCTGGFEGTADFDPGASVFDLTAQYNVVLGNTDIFIQKLNQGATVTSIKELETLPVKLFPNPATTKITIRFPAPTSASATLLNAVGQELKQETIDGVISQDIDLHEFPAGLYFLKITVNGETVIRKIVKN